MRLLGVIPEPPFDPRSWSGSSANFFGALRDHGVLATAMEISLPAVREMLEKARAFSLPLRSWKERYHSSVSRFSALTGVTGHVIASQAEISGIMQIGAWFSAGTSARIPCFSYHDGNAALRYRYYGRGLVSESRQRTHLEWEKSVYSAMTGIFVMSEWLADSFVRDFDVPRSKLHVVGAGINLSNLPRVPERSRFVPRYLFVGQDFQRKGGRYLLEAFDTVRKSLPEAELIIVGPELHLGRPGVQCPGFLDKSNSTDLTRLQELFVSATALVLPSIYEPFGISLLEGMAYALPCIATDRCAMPEIVRHGDTGLVIPAEDSHSLATAMIELGKNPDNAARMGLAGRRRVESSFMWSEVTSKIKTILIDQYRI
jgi:glycosyltransferase involved in cell wall biosynthesis